MKESKWVWCCVVMACGITAVADDWYTWRGPTGDGLSKETDLNPTEAAELWKKELGAGYSSVSVKEGKLYTMGHLEGEDIVYCLDAETGSPVWEYRYTCEPGKFKGPRATPVVDEGKVYTVSRSGDVICLDALSGTLNWKIDVLDKSGNKDNRWGVASSAVIDGDLLLLNVGKAGVALNKHSGEVVWKSEGQGSYASPVVFDHKGQRLAAIFSAPGLHIVDVATGAIVDEIGWTTKYDINGADPLVIGDKIFISSGYDRECALFDFSAGKLKKLWNSDIMKNQFSSSIYMDGYIYGVDGLAKKKGFLRCIDARDGSEVWNMPIGFGSLIAADGKLITLSEKGALFFAEINPAEYNEISTMETGLSRLCWTPPVLANGIVYCRNDKGSLVAIHVK